MIQPPLQETGGVTPAACLDELVRCAEVLIEIVRTEFDCGGEKECIKRYQGHVDDARRAVEAVRVNMGGEGNSKGG